jgi:hypothetical protein
MQRMRGFRLCPTLLVLTLNLQHKLVEAEQASQRSVGKADQQEQNARLATSECAMLRDQLERERRYTEQLKDKLLSQGERCVLYFV